MRCQNHSPTRCGQYNTWPSLPSVHVSRKSISGQWPLLLQSRRPTGRPATSWCHTHGRSWSSGLLLRLTNGLAAVSTKERKGGDGARRWIEGGSKNGPFLRGNSALPPRCCTHDVLHNLQMAKSCRNSASLEAAPSAEGGRQQLFRKCFCQICLWVTYAGSRSRQDVLQICVPFVPKYVVPSFFKVYSRVKCFFSRKHHASCSTNVLPTIPFVLGMGLDPGYSNTWASFFGLSLIPKNPQQLWERLSRSFLIWDHDQT